MLKTDKIIVVEGKYDKIRLDGVVDALIITTDGFGIFREKEKQDFIKRAGAERGVVIITDSDAAGFKIRNYLKNLVPEDRVTHVYIPDVYGKERRKDEPSREGKLGVEGIDDPVLRQALLASGVFSDGPAEEPKRRITFTDLYEAGLSGGEGSAQRRRRFLTDNSLPARLTGNNLLRAVNTFFDYDGFFEAVGRLD